MSSSAITLDANWTPCGYAQVTSLNSVKTLPNAGGGRAALIQAEGEDVRWRDDGEDPTDTVGMILFEGQDMFYTGDLNKLKFIEAAASATLNVSLYKTPNQQV